MTHAPLRNGRLVSFKILLACTGLLSILPATAADTQAKPYVAKVNGVAISAAALDRAVAEAGAAGQPDTPVLRTLLVQRLVAEELFWQEARKLNLQNNAEAAEAAEQARRRSAIGQYIQRSVKPAAPGETELRQRYDRIVANLGPREYRISLIQTADEAALRESAKRIAGGADFAAEAKRVSQVASAQRGGSLNWLSFTLPPAAGRTNGLPLPIAQAIVSLKPGAISAPIALDDNTWAVIRVDEERPTQIPDYQVTRSTLLQAAQVQAAAADGRGLAERLIGAARIEWNPAYKPDAGGTP